MYVNKRSFALCSLLCLLCVFVYFHSIKRTKGFSQKKILSHHLYHPRWDMGDPTPDQEHLLDQVDSQLFCYLGSGKDCYVFISEDGELVIKCFKQKHMKTALFIRSLPLPPRLKKMRDALLLRRMSNRHRHFTSYQIAYERLPNKTAVLYLHLNPTRTLNRLIHLLTPSGKTLILKMDQTEFLIQRRIDPVFTHIKTLMENNQVKAAKEAISSLLDLLTHCSIQGIRNNDNNCEHNLGFIEGKGVHIDVGEFHPTVLRAPTIEEFQEGTNDLHIWLMTNYPELATYLENEIQLKSPLNRREGMEL